jgi:hypothetical protein
LVKRPYKNQATALRVRKKERVKGMNSALFVLITTNCVRTYRMHSMDPHVNQIHTQCMQIYMRYTHMRRASERAYDDAQGGDEDGHGEGEADAAEHPDAVRLRDEHDGDDGDEREGGHVEEEEGGERPQPGAPRRVDEVEEDVGGLHHAPEGVDGEQRAGVGLHQRVQDPQRAAEQSHHVRHRAEPLRRLLPVHAEERRPACIPHTHKFIHSFIYVVFRSL